MKYDIQMGSGAMIYTPSIITFGSDIRKLVDGVYADTQTGRQSRKLTLVLTLRSTFFFVYMQRQL
jgi:hypothetical protein